VRAGEIAKSRGTSCSWQLMQETPSVPCSSELSDLLKRAASRHQSEVIELASGAGHDAAVMAQITPAAMLFVQCKNGLSHHPDESANAKDIEVAFHVINDFVDLLAANHA
jgi:allantoate deiminase